MTTVQTSPEWLDLEAVKVLIRTGKVYVNRPFPRDDFAQVINRGSALILGYVSRQDYRQLKQDEEFEEQALPTEAGLCDWRGVMMRRSRRSLKLPQKRKLPETSPKRGKQAVERHA